MARYSARQLPAGDDDDDDDDDFDEDWGDDNDCDFVVRVNVAIYTQHTLIITCI